MGEREIERHTNKESEKKVHELENCLEGGGPGGIMSVNFDFPAFR